LLVASIRKKGGAKAMKKTVLLFVFIILAVLLASCYDAREVTDTAFVQFIGIDRV
jgi:predicted small secreted protein